MSKNTFYHEKLKKLIPGGAHTYSKGDDQWPANAPQCIERGKGCYVWDADGNRFVDWSMGLAAVSLGHANEEINQAAIEAMAIGHNFQRPSVMEAIAAEKFLNFLQDRGEMIKFAKNGSTVTTAAVKLSRAYTRRAKVAVCKEHPFFSYDDWFIGSTLCPDGIPQAIRSLTVKFSYNNIDSVRKMFQENPGEIACMILEPVKFDPPKNNFLNEIYEECKKHGAVLILDEMVTGFKWHNQGAAKHYGAKADIYTWGKGMANGHSVCALTGRADIMHLGGIDHDKPRVFLTSTTHGAEIPQLAAFMKTLDIFTRDNPIPKNWERGRKLRSQLMQLTEKHDVQKYLDFIGEDCFFSVAVKNPGIHKTNVTRTYLLQELIKQGQLFQGLFNLTASHNEDILAQTVAAWDVALPAFKYFVEQGKRAELVGEPTKPVFRAYNKCECLSPDDCKKCFDGLAGGK